MQRVISLMALILTVSFHAASMEQEEGKFFERKAWCVVEPDADNCTKHGKITKLVIGHTVIDQGNSMLTLHAIQKDHMDRFSDIGYHFCMDEIDCFECRSLSYAPAILQGHNIGSCAIGLIGRYDNHEDARTISEKIMKCWAKHFAMIAKKVGITELVYKENVFGMSDLEPKKYPVSPGERVLAVIEKVLEMANIKLNTLNSL